MTFTLLNTLLLIAMLIAGVWTIMTLNLLKSAIGLAVTSAVLTLLLFQMKAPLAGVFELSVCAGLITVVFISTISLTRPLTGQEAQKRDLSRLKRFIFLPILLILTGAVLFRMVFSIDTPPLPPLPAEAQDVRHVLWNFRRIDLLGQILILLVGIFGVVVLFKEHGRHDKGEPSS